MTNEVWDSAIEMRLPSDPKYLALVRCVVGAAASIESTLSDARIGDLELVVTELFTNAMEANWRAASPPGRGEDRGTTADQTDLVAAGVLVRCVIRPGEIHVTVSDSGPGFDASDDVHPPVEDPSRLDYESGLGLPLIQYLADRVDYVTSPEGTSATVVLRNRV